MQGSCAIHREDLPNLSINYVRTDVEKRRIFALVNTNICPYGYGVRNSCLDPFYTLAADPAFHPFGTVIYIEKIRGTVLPDGSKHSGYFIVRDTGGGIKGKGRFDFFTGFYSHRTTKNPFAKLGLGDQNTHYPYRVITGDLALDVKASRAFPQIKRPE
jgi:3D (Asp-Asp-Asp) domain-containing protein